MPSGCISLKRGCDLRIGGIVAFTTIDFPGRLAAVLFCQGCPWRCTYCHNKHLLPFSPGTVAWPAVVDFLRTRKDLLEAVVFSGGEPLAQPTLPEAMRAVRALGFRIGLHTSGVSPARLARVLPLVDWIGLDVKASRARYREVTGADAGAAVYRSLALILDAGVDYQVRTTVHDPADLAAVRLELDAAGASRWVVQERRLTHIKHAPALAS